MAKLVIALVLVLAAGCAAAQPAPITGEFGRHVGPERMMVLANERGDCHAGWRRLAGYVGENRFTGCFLEVGERILVVFHDDSMGFFDRSFFGLKAL